MPSGPPRLTVRAAHRTRTMAETKRQSIAGKIATPKVGPSKDAIDGDAMLYKAVGARYVSLPTHNPPPC